MGRNSLNELRIPAWVRGLSPGQGAKRRAAHRTISRPPGQGRATGCGEGIGARQVAPQTQSLRFSPRVVGRGAGSRSRSSFRPGGRLGRPCAHCVWWAHLGLRSCLTHQVTSRSTRHGTPGSPGPRLGGSGQSGPEAPPGGGCRNIPASRAREPARCALCPREWEVGGGAREARPRRPELTYDLVMREPIY